MTTSSLSPVIFHGDTLHILSQNGEPFTPMKPIVENMGLDWRTQQRKLDANRGRWGMVMMTIPSTSGDQQTLCMPVRKLPAFMASINPKKVREELRERIRLYQDECDNALWDYWTKGQATKRGRKPAQKALPKPSTQAYPRFTPRTTLEEIEARITALHQHFSKERYAIYVDLLNQFCNTYTPRVVPADVVCSSVSDAIYNLILECVTSASDTPLKYNNPCKLVREVRDMLESVRS